MAERRATGSEFDRARAEGAPPMPSAEGLPPSSNEPPLRIGETNDDAAWTERMLNSLVASGRRERGLERRAHSDARSYAAYDAVATPVGPTPNGIIDRGTVEVSLGEPAPRDREDEHARRVATTVTLRPRRSSWRRIVLVATACGVAYASAMALRAKRADDPSPPTRPAVSAGVEGLSVPLSAEPKPVVSTTPTIGPSVEARPTAAPMTRAAERTNRQSIGPTPVPSGSDAPADHRAFVDVVNRY